MLQSKQQQQQKQQQQLQKLQQHQQQGQPELPLHLKTRELSKFWKFVCQTSFVALMVRYVWSVQEDDQLLN